MLTFANENYVAVDVNIYASSPSHAPPLVGNHENTEVGDFISDYLGLDVEAITQELRDKGVKTSSDGYEYDWMGPPNLTGKKEGEALVALDSYHGDFKHRKREADGDCGCGMKH